MPSTYLCHGFRWHRDAIRLYVMMKNLELCAPDWIIGWETSEHLLESLYNEHTFIPGPLDDEAIRKQEAELAAAGTSSPPKFGVPPPRKPKSEDFVLRHEWSAIKVLEEYDDEDTSTHCRPYAFVADHVVRVELDVDVMEEMSKFNTMTLQQERTWFEKLNQKLQPNEPIRWYVVVVSDEVRDYYPQESDSDEEEDNDEGDAPSNGEKGESSSRGEDEKKKKSWTANVRAKSKERGGVL